MPALREEAKALTSLRGIAALLVAAVHFRKDFGAFSFDHYTQFVDRGYLWVDLFFILSGLVITSVYGEQLAGRFSWRSYGNFLVKRLGRIYPLHVAMLLVLVALETAKFWTQVHHPAFSSNSPRTLLANFALVQCWGFEIDNSVWNAPSWSISAEWVAYLLFPVILLVARAGFLRLGMMAVVAPFAGIFLLAAAFGNLNISNNWPAIARCLLSFSVGALIAMLLDAPLGGKLRGLWSDLLCLAALAGAITVMHLGAFDALTIPAFAVICFCVARPDCRVARVLAMPPLYYLGTISYSIYLTHYVLRGLWVQFEDRLHLAPLTFWPGLTSFLGVLTLLVCTSSATYRFIESPCRDAVRRWLSTARPLPRGARAV